MNLPNKSRIFFCCFYFSFILKEQKTEQNSAVLLLFLSFVLYLLVSKESHKCFDNTLHLLSQKINRKTRRRSKRMRNSNKDVEEVLIAKKKKMIMIIWRMVNNKKLFTNNHANANRIHNYFLNETKKQKILCFIRTPEQNGN